MTQPLLELQGPLPHQSCLWGAHLGLRDHQGQLFLARLWIEFRHVGGAGGGRKMWECRQIAFIPLQILGAGVGLGSVRERKITIPSFLLSNSLPYTFLSLGWIKRLLQEEHTNQQMSKKTVLQTTRHTNCTTHGPRRSTQQTTHQYAFERVFLRDLGDNWPL